MLNDSMIYVKCQHEQCERIAWKLAFKTERRWLRRTRCDHLISIYSAFSFSFHLRNSRVFLILLVEVMQDVIALGALCVKAPRTSNLSEENLQIGRKLVRATIQSWLS